MCCFFNGECGQVGMDDCLVSGDWKGLGSNCSDSFCSVLEIGVCCIIGVCFEGFLFVECDVLFGEYQGKDFICEDCK